MRDEQGMTEQQLAHFHVRYDGDAHEDVGREILRALERHYATLTGTLDHQPASPIPVILFSREAYYDASGAPAWSGGVYDGLDGRIRIPIGGLTAEPHPGHGRHADPRAHPRLRRRPHAGRGTARDPRGPRAVHGGQALGHRAARASSLTALADGRIGGVGGFYLAALSFVEHLMATRGMGGMNDLLRAMGETGNVDEAFRQVHGPHLPGRRGPGWAAAAPPAARELAGTATASCRSKGRRAAIWPSPRQARPAQEARGASRGSIVDSAHFLFLPLEDRSRGGPCARAARRGATSSSRVDLRPLLGHRDRHVEAAELVHEPVLEGLGARPDAALGDGVHVLVGLLPALGRLASRSPRRTTPSGRGTSRAPRRPTAGTRRRGRRVARGPGSPW